MSENSPVLEPAAQTTDDPRCIPIALDSPIEEGDAIAYPTYTAEEHETWKIMYARQRDLLPTHACKEFLDGMEKLKFPEDRIPALRDVSRELDKATGWKLARSPGLLHEKDFFELLARRVFPSTDYIRPRKELDYTPAPDCFHDIFGHCPMIMLPAFANFYQRIGQAAANAVGDVREGLVRIYWFTVEFGLVRQGGKDLIYGNGIASSYGEAKNSMTAAVEKRPFIPEKVAAQPYDIWHFQPVLFVVDSFEHLESSFDDWAKRNGLVK
jgi:phenylalanine-4-hydroxylase